MSIQLRNHHRVVYPPSDRPTLKIGGNSFDILDLSESGIRYSLGKNSPPSTGVVLRVSVHLHDGSVSLVSATLLKVTGDVVILSLSPGLPLGIIRAEERYLLQRYPNKKIA